MKPSCADQSVAAMSCVKPNQSPAAGVPPTVATRPEPPRSTGAVVSTGVTGAR